MSSSSSPIAVSKSPAKKSAAGDRPRPRRRRRSRTRPRAPAPPHRGRRPGRRARARRRRCPGAGSAGRRWSRSPWSAGAGARARPASSRSVWYVVIAPITSVIAVVADAAQRLDPAEVDDQLGGVEPHPEDRQQALAAGEHLGLVAGLGERARAPPRRSSGPRSRTVRGSLGTSFVVEPAPGSAFASAPAPKCGCPRRRACSRLDRRSGTGPASGSPSTPARACTASGRRRRPSAAARRRWR